METIQIEKICRVCLREDDTMIDLSENVVYEKFLLFANLSAKDEISKIPLKLCQSCEQKLSISLDFKEQCQKSHTILSNNTRINSVKVETKNQSRFDQFPQDVVWEAIRELKQRSYTNCIRCSYVGDDATALSVHASQTHKDFKSGWCCQCNIEFDNITEHVTTNHSDDYTCKFCGTKYDIVSDLTEHLRLHSNAKQFRCSFCQKCFFKETTLRAHLNNHVKEKLYKCGLCDKSFTQLYHLKYHSKTHNCDEGVKKQDFTERQNFCVKCNRNVRSLVVHTKLIHGMGDYNHPCSVCGNRFKTDSDLEKHMQTHTRRQHKCTFCNKVFRTHNRRVDHENTHTGIRPHICQVCGKGFAQLGTLNSHMMVHNIGVKISCDVCNKKFCRTNQLTLHLRTHTGEKPYVCTECGKGFSQKPHLISHVKVHSGLRPYKCSCCDKSFRQNPDLKRHMLIHSGEKPYKCSQCSYACRHGSALTLHMMKHTIDKPQPDKPYACTMCRSTFTTDAMLTSHVNAHNVGFLDISS